MNVTHFGPPARAIMLALAVLISAGCSKSQPVTVIAPSKFIFDLSRDDAGRDVFAVEGFDEQRLLSLAVEKPTNGQWQAWFSVKVSGGDGPPMLGEYFVSGNRLCFRPSFPLIPGKRYQATVGNDRAPDEAAPRPRAAFDIPRQALPPSAQVAAIFPSADRLPENLLRVYLQFTGPMRRGDVYDFVRLLGQDGKPVESPSVTFGEELWTADGTRLTLLLDPGRQKHDLLPRQQAGPVLEAGKQYSLVISGDWPDAYGRPLGHEFRKQFTAVAADPRPIQPGDWKLTAPPAGSREPLIVKFDRPLDHALLQRMDSVADSKGIALEGDMTLNDNESTWRFVPRQPWPAGEYSLVVEPNLEDVSGNRVGRAFEVDEDRTETGPVAVVRRVFAVGNK